MSSTEEQSNTRPLVSEGECSGSVSPYTALTHVHSNRNRNRVFRHVEFSPLVSWPRWKERFCGSVS